MACADVIIRLVPIDYWNSEAFLVYHEYHDKRLCKPDLRHNDQEIFAQLRLEMFAAVLSLVTILEKEANLRKAFDIILIPTYDA